jgi:uncharacterized protein YbbC (DUF1343 family)
MVATALLKSAWRLWPDEAQWRTERYEYVSEPIAIDLLGGGPTLRNEVEEDVPLAAIQDRWDDEVQPFLKERKQFLLY